MSPVSRRTAVTGAAWSVPAVIAASAAPAFASSTTKIAFDQTIYLGVTCTTMLGVSVSVTPATAGTTVTITVTGGLTVAGATTATAVTNQAGRAVFPGITPPAVATDTVITAAVGTAQATARFIITEERSVRTATAAHRNTTLTSSGTWGASTQALLPLAGGYFLDGTSLRLGSTVVATGVSAAQGASGGPVLQATFVTTDGVAHTVEGTSAVVDFATVPSNSVPIGAGYFLAGTDLYHRGTLRSTSVQTAQGHLTGSGLEQAAVVLTDGSAALITPTAITALPGVPTNSIPVGATYFLAGTDLYMGNARAHSSVKAANGYYGADGSGPYATYVTTSGTAHLAPSGAQSTRVPAHATPLGAYHFLAGTTLYVNDKVVASDVQLACGYPASKNPDLTAVAASDCVAYTYRSC